MAVTRIKGPIIRWADLEAEEKIGWAYASDRREYAERLKVKHAADLTRLKEIDSLIREQLKFSLKNVTRMIDARLGDIEAEEIEDIMLIVGAIDFSGSSHSDQKGIWSARRHPGQLTGFESDLLHDEEPHVSVELRPGGPGGQSAESRSFYPTMMIKRMGMRLLGERSVDDIVDEEPEEDD